MNFSIPPSFYGLLISDCRVALGEATLELCPARWLTPLRLNIQRGADQRDGKVAAEQGPAEREPVDRGDPETEHEGDAQGHGHPQGIDGRWRSIQERQQGFEPIGSKAM